MDDFFLYLFGIGSEVLLLIYYMNGYEKQTARLTPYMYCLGIVGVMTCIHLWNNEIWFRQPVYCGLFFIFIFCFHSKMRITAALFRLFIYLVVLGIVEVVVVCLIMVITGNYSIDLISRTQGEAYLTTILMKSITFIVFWIYKQTGRKKQRYSIRHKKGIVYITLAMSLFALLIITRDLYLINTMQQQEFVITLIVVGIMIIFSTACFLIFLDYFVVLKEKEEQILFLEHRNKQQYELYQQKILHMHDIKNLQHDVKRNIAYLLYCIQTETFNEGIEYAGKLLNEYQHYDEKNATITGNNIMDYLLLDLRQRCEKEDIDLTLDLKAAIPKLSDYDIAAVFGNILENAIEAVMLIDSHEMRKIDMKWRIREQFWVVRITNTVSPNYMSEAENLVTRKNNKEEHGIGLINVKKVIDKYEGKVIIKVEDYIFNLTILVPVD